MAAKNKAKNESHVSPPVGVNNNLYNDWSTLLYASNNFDHLDEFYILTLCIPSQLRTLASIDCIGELCPNLTPFIHLST